MREGYLLLYFSDGDETHANLISKEHYDRIIEAQRNCPPGEYPREMEDAAWGTEPIERFMIQTYCSSAIEACHNWPYNNVKILGTVSVPCC